MPLTNDDAIPQKAGQPSLGSKFHRAIWTAPTDPGAENPFASTNCMFMTSVEAPVQNAIVRRRWSMAAWTMTHFVKPQYPPLHITRICK
jgi:hypothetical protein